MDFFLIVFIWDYWDSSGLVQSRLSVFRRVAHHWCLIFLEKNAPKTCILAFYHVCKYIQEFWYSLSCVHRQEYSNSLSLSSCKIVALYVYIRQMKIPCGKIISKRYFFKQKRVAVVVIFRLTLAFFNSLQFFLSKFLIFPLFRSIYRLPRAVVHIFVVVCYYYCFIFLYNNNKTYAHDVVEVWNELWFLWRSLHDGNSWSPICLFKVDLSVFFANAVEIRTLIRAFLL